MEIYGDILGTEKLNNLSNATESDSIKGRERSLKQSQLLGPLQEESLVIKVRPEEAEGPSPFQRTEVSVNG